MRHLAMILVILLVAAILGLSRNDPGNITPGLIAWLSIMLILELPCFWWRMRGGSPLSTLVVALACPFVVLEGLMIYPAYKYRHVGGDLQGIETLIMEFIIPPAVLVTGTVMAILAMILVRQRDRTESHLAPNE